MASEKEWEITQNTCIFALASEPSSWALSHI